MSKYTMISLHVMFPVMLNDAKTSRPRPRPELRGRGRGQSFEAGAEAKNNYGKYQIG